MATIGRSLLRFTRALLLGASATAIDHPKPLVAPTAPGLIAPDSRSAKLDVRIAPGNRVFTGHLKRRTNRDVILPNSRVDVFEEIDDPERHRLVGKLVVENLRVLAIDSVSDRSLDGRTTKAAVATIEVTPLAGKFLSTAVERGSLDLVLNVERDSASSTTCVLVVTLVTFENASSIKRRH